MLRSNSCNCIDVYIVIKGEITAEENSDANIRNKKLIFKNNAPVRSCISKINDKFIESAEDLDIIRIQWQLFYNIWKFVKSL